MLNEITTTSVESGIRRSKAIIPSSIHLDTEGMEPYFEFIIRVNGEEVWCGVEMEQPFIELLDQYPDGNFSIGWRSSPMVMI